MFRDYLTAAMDYAVPVKIAAGVPKIADPLQVRKLIATMVRMMIATVLPIAMIPNAPVTPDVPGTVVMGFVIRLKIATVALMIVRA